MVIRCKIVQSFWMVLIHRGFNLKMIRLIGRIDVRNGFHIKTIQCEGVSKLRPVSDSIKAFSNGSNEHDELILIDSVASLYGFQNWLLRQHEYEFFYSPIPLAIGGALSSIDDVKETLAKGADKIVINTAAINDSGLLKDISHVCGSQALVLQIDTMKIAGEYRCFTHGAREMSRYTLEEWLHVANESGVGELHITSIETEGTESSFPVELAALSRGSTSLPLIVSGGINSSQVIADLYHNYSIDAFSISSIVNRLGISILSIRQHLCSLGIPVRLGN